MYEMGTIIVLISQAKKLKYKNAKLLVPKPAVSKGQS